jgi:hypothetical protein
VVPLLDLNTSPYWDSCPALSLDEHRLYITSTRPGGCGGEDIWVSRRHDRRDYLNWGPPVHIDGCGLDQVNSSFRELAPAFFEDESGRMIMYFVSNRMANQSGVQQFDIYQADVMEDGSFGPATPVAELNDPEVEDLGVVVRRDGLEVIFGSRHGHPGSLTLWTATRESTSDLWSPPVELSLGAFSGRIALSADGRELYFTSGRAGGIGNSDIWMSTREKITGKK